MATRGTFFDGGPLPDIKKHDWPVAVTRCWVPDEQADACTGCQAQFRRLTFRHHCRYCGGSFCGSCSKRKLEFLLPEPELHRVCEACFSKQHKTVPLDCPPCAPTDMIAVELLNTLKNGDTQKAMEILDGYRTEPFAVDASQEYTTPLLHCVRHGLVELTKDLLCKGARLHIDECLHAALELEHLELFEMLLQFQASADSTIGESETVLIQSILRMRPSFVRALLGHEAKPNLPSRDGLTPLCVAAVGSTIEVVEILLKGGANPNIYVGDEKRPLLAVAIEEGRYDIVNTLIECGKGLQVELVDHLTGLTPLMLAASVSNVRVVRSLVLLDVALDTQDSRGRTALMMAAANGYHNVCRALLGGGSPERVADVKLVDHEGVSSLALTVAFLLSPDASRHDVTGMGNVLRLLMRKGAPSSCLMPGSTDGMTVLMAVAAQGDPWPCVLEALLRGSADVRAVNDHGHSALTLAAGGGHAHVVGRLLSANPRPDVDRRTESGETALMLAARGGHAAVAAMLCQAGAAVDVVGSHGHTAIDIAATAGQADVLSAIMFNIDDKGQHLPPQCTAAFALALSTQDSGLLCDLLDGGAGADVAGLLVDVVSEGDAALFSSAARRADVHKLRKSVQDGSGDTALIAAARSQGEELHVLLAGGEDDCFNVNARNARGSSALLEACRVGSSLASQLLSVKGVDVNIRDAHGCTPLMLAAAGGRSQGADVVWQLLRAGADVAAQDLDESSALTYAAAGGNTFAAAALLEYGAEAQPDRNKDTPLHVAVKGSLFAGSGSYAAVCRTLLEGGVDVDTLNDDGHTPLGLLAARLVREESSEDQQLLAMCQHLLRYGASLAAASSVVDEQLVLVSAIRSGKRATLAVLLEGLSTLPAPSVASALMAAVEGGPDTAWALAALLRAGADVNVSSSFGRTPLIRACDPATVGECSALRVVLGFYPDLDIKMDDGRTALYVAVEENNVEGVQRLLAAGADPNVLVAESGGLYTCPLMVALKANAAGMVAMLLRHGAEHTPQLNPNGVMVGDTMVDTPVAAARAMKANDLLEMLVYFGARADIEAGEDDELAGGAGTVVTSHLPGEDPMGMRSFAGGDFCQTASGEVAEKAHRESMGASWSAAREHQRRALQARLLHQEEERAELQRRAVNKKAVLLRLAVMHRDADARYRQEAASLEQGGAAPAAASAPALPHGEHGHSSETCALAEIEARAREDSNEFNELVAARLSTKLSTTNPGGEPGGARPVSSRAPKKTKKSSTSANADPPQPGGGAPVASTAPREAPPEASATAPPGEAAAAPPGARPAEQTEVAGYAARPRPAEASVEPVPKEATTKTRTKSKRKGTISKKKEDVIAGWIDDEDPLFMSTPKRSLDSKLSSQGSVSDLSASTGNATSPKKAASLEGGDSRVEQEQAGGKVEKKKKAKSPRKSTDFPAEEPTAAPVETVQPSHPDYTVVFHEIFLALGKTRAMKDVVNLLNATKLPKDTLREIWGEAKLSANNIDEFSVVTALKLCSLHQKGVDPSMAQLARVGPDKVWPPTFGRDAPPGVRAALSRFAAAQEAKKKAEEPVAPVPEESKAQRTKREKAEAEAALSVFSSTSRKKKKPKKRGPDIFGDL